MDNDGKIECLICGKKLSAINYLHLRKHDISVEDYVNKFPDAKLCSDQTRTVMSLGSKGRIVSEGVRKKQSEAAKASWLKNPNLGNSGQHRPEEVKRKISNTLKGFSPWNKGSKKAPIEDTSFLGENI